MLLLWDEFFNYIVYIYTQYIDVCYSAQIIASAVIVTKAGYLVQKLLCQ